MAQRTRSLEFTTLASHTHCEDGRQHLAEPRFVSSSVHRSDQGDRETAAAKLVALLGREMRGAHLLLYAAMSNKTYPGSPAKKLLRGLGRRLRVGRSCSKAENHAWSTRSQPYAARKAD
jgi:hypothetical protein